MRRIILLTCSLILVAIPVLAQQKKSTTRKTVSENKVSENAIRKYPSLLWEISGNGLKKPSYLFGTMHVSDKLAFHLGDSFYNAIKSSDVVALETNPETWQQDYSESVFFRRGNRGRYMDLSSAESFGYMNDMMRITSFAIDDYQEAIKAMLAVEPSMINGMLYRTYGTRMDDFEEDTFLDMYIFQAGKKLGKRLAGVENFQESEKLVMEAYRDMMRDRNKKRKSFDFEGMLGNPKKLEDAYRKGDLDLLDSLESLTVFSDAFQEKFLYKRNEIQANSIDSIIKKSTLFVGVGAAHLPGKRGVIEMLRRMGYTLRPVKMDERSSVQKEAIDKLRSNNVFELQTSDDSFYKVAIPGKKFYRFTEWGGMDVVQFADLVNGAYYMVTRVKTNSYSWGHSTDLVHKKIDSLLYENIPGKILKKTPITRNGYKGWEILNRTRRGDHQRYNVFITPFEVITFKMSGNGDYINNGEEAQRFFSSIQLKEYPAKEWISFKPTMGGFTAQFPHAPSLLKDENYGTDRLEYAAQDGDGNSYLVMKTNFHNYSFVEADSFELNLMEESYSFSPFIEKQLSRRFYVQNGYPALQAIYKHNDGSFSNVKYIIRGAMYYVAIARYKKENESSQRFLKSFEITPFIYPETVLRKDTSIKFSVYSPFFPDDKKKNNELDELEELYNMSMADDDEEYDYRDMFGHYKTSIIGNDTLGEKIVVVYLNTPQYSFEKDTTAFWKKSWGDELDDDSSFIYKVNKRYVLPNGAKVREMEYTDTGSSRLVISKMIYKNGHLFAITTLTDTSSRRSPFIEKFFATFTPVDTLKGQSLHVRKSEQFFKDYFSTDSAVARKARRSMYQIDFDSLDVPLLKDAIKRLNWSHRSYLQSKKQFIGSLGEIRDSTSVEFLKKIYFAVKDTSELQNAILIALLDQKSKIGFATFKELILQEPPIIDEDSYDYSRHYRTYSRMARVYVDGEYTGYTGMWPVMYDTLSLTKTIFPDFLQLMNVDDYKEGVMNLLTALVDSGYLKATDYESFFSKFYLEAKQLLKKQVAREEKDNIEKAGKKDRSSTYSPLDVVDVTLAPEMESGNDELERYSVLLLPFYDKNQGVADFFQQLLKTKDRQLLYNTFILLLRNKKPVHDSLFLKYAKLDEYRSKLYEDLKKMKQLDKFPAVYKNQLDIAKSILVSNMDRYDRVDTIAFVDKLPVTYKGKKGYVYFFKYKQMRDDAYWQLASVGMQPENLTEVDIEDDEFTTRADRKLESGKPVKEQLDKMLKEMIHSKHSSASIFYEARSLNIYKSYLSEMVKRGRYRD